MEKLQENVMKTIIDEAHRHQLRATVHTWHEQDAIDVLQAGADGVEHGVGHALLTNDTLAKVLLARKATYYVPTLRVLTLAKPPRTLPIGKQNLKRLANNGVPVAVGTDTLGGLAATPPGLNTIQELELMVEAGLPTHDVIEAATRNAAEHLGLAKDLGTVEPGKIADLIIVDGDPLADISALRNVEIVVQAGRVVHKVD